MLALGPLLGLPEGARAQRDSLRRFVFRQGHMGMEVRLVLYASSWDTATSAARAAYRRIGRLDSLLSSYRDDSELAHVNRQAGEAPVQVSDHLFSILRRAKEFARRSGGALDVTAGPLIELWRRARRTRQFPDSSALRRARARVGWRHLVLDERQQTVFFARPGMKLNLGSLAKGYILDQGRAVLRAEGISRALIEAGGDLVVGAAPPGRDGWRIDIPHGGGGAPSTVVTVVHSAVATSGDRAQYVIIEGTRYSHVIDPRTGIGLTDQPTTTVIADEGIVADALATSIGILGVEKGRSLAATYPDVRCYVSEGDSTTILGGP